MILVYYTEMTFKIWPRGEMIPYITTKAKITEHPLKSTQIYVASVHVSPVDNLRIIK